MPDATGTIGLSGTNGKVALVNNATALTGACPTGMVDLVGYGSANCYEGTAATPALSNTTAAIRKSDGAQDTNDNSADFEIGAPNPRNSANPFLGTPGDACHRALRRTPFSRRGSPPVTGATGSPSLRLTAIGGWPANALR